MRKFIIIAILLTLNFSITYSQTDSAGSKKILDHSVYNSWNRLENVNVSENGKFISYEVNRQKGDGKLIIYSTSAQKEIVFPRSSSSLFSPDESFAAFRIKASDDTLRKYKFEKKKKETFPKDTLGIYIFGDQSIEDSLIRIPKFQNFKIPEKGLPVIAYMTEIDRSKKDTLSTNGKSVYNLTVFEPGKGRKITFDSVLDYEFSGNGKKLGVLIFKKGKADTTQVIIYDVEKQTSDRIFSKRGYCETIVIDETGDKTAFLYSRDTTKVKRYGLYTGNKSGVKLIADTSNINIPSEWEISPNTELAFSNDGKKLYFGTAPKIQPEPKDTLLDEEKFKVDVWNWQDPFLQTQQLHDLESTKKKVYAAVYDTELNSIYQIANENTEDIKATENKNSRYILGLDYSRYKRSSSWIQPDQIDLYSIDYTNDKRVLVAEGVQQDYNISPTGKYITYFDNSDSSFYAYSNEEGSKYSLTGNLPVKFCDELNDVPNIPNAYGIAGWTTNDEYVLINDRYDIWQISPRGLAEPKRLTKGREDSITYRYVDMDKDSVNIGLDDKIYLRGVNENDHSESISEMTLNSGVIKQVVKYDAKITGMAKAKKQDILIFRKETYTEFPDLWVKSNKSPEALKISDANPQMKEYLWGTVEQISWKGFEGEDMKGLLYKPENFDPGRKYPVISYFYEKHTQNFHNHFIPAPSRSTVNMPLYNSNGYIVFVPDIQYKVGYPGRSAYNTVVSGAKYLADNFPFIDRDNFGIQGQSWGGYQVAYLVTVTDFFKAAMSGAPVSNMTSAYGGIRWESGVNRIFQYEKEQSRIGGTLWEKFDLFVENSPLFKADKVTTPLLIMSNDADGAVPWQQGIEFFVSLRRLDKKVWMLSYNGDEHNLTKWPNRVDLSIRMKQFFDHYLKGEPMPEWMKKGIPAIEKGKKNGYNLEN
jgi:dipeptidyl aminopeptidase/acylaminoacyl peptidase